MILHSEYDIALHFRELSVSDEDLGELGELPGILSQVVLAMHHFRMIVTYKILNISVTIPVSTLASGVQLFNSSNKISPICWDSSCFRKCLPNLCFI